MTQKDEFFTEIIINVIMLIRLDKNVTKILFLDVNVNNFFLDKNVNIFLLEKNVNNFFKPKCHYVSIGLKMLISCHYWTKNVNNIFIKPISICFYWTNLLDSKFRFI